MENKKAPLGIRILAGLYFFALGAYTISLWSLIASGKFEILLEYYPTLAAMIVILTILMIALAGVWYGLLKLNPTAWKIAMVFYGIGVIIDIISLKIVYVIVDIIILWYLYSKKELYLGAEASDRTLVPTPEEQE